LERLSFRILDHRSSTVSPTVTGISGMPPPPQVPQLENLLTRRAEVVPTNCDCARARAKLTIYQPLAVERLSTSNGQ
jgi:hypothetical protein